MLSHFDVAYGSDLLANVLLERETVVGIEDPERLNTQTLAEDCAARDVLIEPGDIFFNKTHPLASHIYVWDMPPYLTT